VTTGGDVDHVDFLVDGVVRDTERSAPYAFAGGAWDTTRVTNGRHVLGVRAVARDGAVAKTSLVAVVKNQPIRISGVTVAGGQTLTGTVRIEAVVRGTPLRVEFVVDGVIRDTESTPPYVLGGATGSWDTTRETNGAHTLVVRAIGPAGKPAATRTIHVIVANP
jgi:hypothetical protein